MQALLPLGRGLLALAILSLVGELTARAFFSAGGLYLSAEELWAALAAGSYTAARDWFRQGALPVWTYGLGPALKLPAWLLLGGPGIAALWFAEKREFAEEIAAITDSALLYDELEKQAKEEGYLGDFEPPPADDAEGILASAREAEADMAHDPANGLSDADAKTGAGDAPASRFPS